ncbi:four-carbon acid sugar kinase family protein [Clostridium sp. SYSU_GA19001]|uniref:four-carbon acid sugar kinase family protein n=1 Tax=Clostridium caldaquaticum TaxID=2940653 RepID=UPI002076F66C|nr:four-carbon acid sugar kinase family protein [Clostridium caldaquaticum]MCM8711693.1 four-carbon acid sugar kinase family protein [Clostridium caldaquaticum]
MKSIRLAVIADDITGASDCGGQLVHYGLDVSVILNNDLILQGNKEAVIFNTDSRSIPESQAYEKVNHICQKIKNEYFDVIYKKIDSTMRGNIGQEINAVYDVFKPDFMLIAPGFPENGRQVIDGIHFLNQKQLHETEVAKDPKTPVTDSNIMRLIRNQAKKEVGHISYKELREGYECVARRLAYFKNNNISYVTVDSVEESDLKCLVQIMYKTDYSVVWVGSAGLMNYLPQVYGLNKKKTTITIEPSEKPVLLVIGSVSAIAREQLEQLLKDQNVAGLEMKSTEIIVNNKAKEQEIKRLKQEAILAFKQKKNIALFSSWEVAETQKIGRDNGYNAVEVSNMISNTLGELAVELIQELDLRRLFLTGGDTAFQVFAQLHMTEFHLIDEVESGIPIGKLQSDKEIYAVTKAGNFGTSFAMVNALNILQGGII